MALFGKRAAASHFAVGLPDAVASNCNTVSDLHKAVVAVLLAKGVPPSLELDAQVYQEIAAIISEQMRLASADIRPDSRPGRRHHAERVTWLGPVAALRVSRMRKSNPVNDAPQDKERPHVWQMSLRDWIIAIIAAGLMFLAFGAAMSLMGFRGDS